jgi:hypothetical protein
MRGIGPGSKPHPAYDARQIRLALEIPLTRRRELIHSPAFGVIEIAVDDEDIRCMPLCVRKSALK